MTPSPRASPPPGLEALLQALRAVGLPVGAREVVRLHHVFALEPGLGQDRAPESQLRDLLASALVHQPGERELLEQVYEPWAEQWGEWERSLRPAPPKPEPEPPARVRGERRVAERPPRRWWASWRLWGRLLAPAALALLIQRPAIFWPVDQVTTTPPTAEATPTADGFRILVPEAPNTFTQWVPRLEVIHEGSQPEGLAWPLIVLGTLALVVAAGLGWRYARKPWLPEPLPDPEPGPARLPLLPFAAAEPQLLDADSARTLVWGVGRHVSERLTSELDLEATARESARSGGLPELRYEPEKHLREVWLWLDGTVGDPAMERWAEEVAASLSAAGLPVRIGGFDGYPRELLWDEGQVFRPQEVEAHRQTALVAVCTDGAVLARHLEDERGAEVRLLLRALAAWPRLAFVDFSRRSDSARLARVLGPSGLVPVTPEDLPAFFGLGAFPAPGRAEVDPGELRAWRAALALGGRPVDRATAHAVRRELRLEVSPWAFYRLQGDGDRDETLPESLGGSLVWTERGREALVAWLAEGSFDEPSGLRPGSLHERALDFWQRRLAGEAEERERRGELDPWKDHPAERHLAMERALLRLWREPAEAAEELFRLRAGELGEEIAARLGRLSPRDGGGAPIRLPWRLADLETDRARFLLAKLGLGGLKPGDLRRPGRLGLGLGVLASLGLGLLGAGLLQPRSPAEGDAPVIVPQGEAPPAGTDDFFYYGEQLADGRWPLFAGTPRGPVVSEVVGPGATVAMRWTTVEGRPCIDGAGESQLWRCGSSPHRPTTRDVYRDWPRRSLAVVLAPAADGESRALAAALIDSGSADAVLLGMNAAERIDELVGNPGSDLRSDQMVVIDGRGAGFDTLRRQVTIFGRYVYFEGLAPVLTRLKDPLAVDGVFRLFNPAAPEGNARLSSCPWQEGVHEATAMRFLRICGGTFRMGSEDDDPQAYDDEKPAHEVEVGGFWIGETEVRNAEYRAHRPEHQGDDDLPAVDVSWFEARDYCRSLGESEEWEYDLPTEAEWEYAARAGTKTAWSFGDEEERLGEYAWFSGNSGKRPHAVRTKKPNPWGLYDMDGNVWEWVLDCYDRYGSGPMTDPGLADDTCHERDTPPSAVRVLRGGAYWVEPRNLRSAYRVGVEPEVRREAFGFRCVRRPRRQLDPSTP